MKKTFFKALSGVGKVSTNVLLGALLWGEGVNSVKAVEVSSVEDLQNVGPQDTHLKLTLPQDDGERREIAEKISQVGDSFQNIKFLELSLGLSKDDKVRAQSDKKGEEQNDPQYEAPLQKMLWHKFEEGENVQEDPAFPSLVQRKWRFYIFDTGLCLENIVTLKISDTKMTVISDEIGRLTSLREFDASGNDIFWVTPKIGDLLQIEVVNLSSNPFAYLPSSVASWQKIEKLDLSECNTLEPTGKATTLGRQDLRCAFGFLGNNFRMTDSNLRKVWYGPDTRINQKALQAIPMYKVWTEQEAGVAWDRLKAKGLAQDVSQKQSFQKLFGEKEDAPVTMALSLPEPPVHQIFQRTLRFVVEYLEAQPSGIESSKIVSALTETLSGGQDGAQDSLLCLRKTISALQLKDLSIFLYERQAQQFIASFKEYCVNRALVPAVICRYPDESLGDYRVSSLSAKQLDAYRIDRQDLVEYMGPTEMLLAHLDNGSMHHPDATHLAEIFESYNRKMRHPALLEVFEKWVETNQDASLEYLRAHGLLGKGEVTYPSAPLPLHEWAEKILRQLNILQEVGE